MSLDGCPTTSAPANCANQVCSSISNTSTSADNGKITAITLPSGQYSLQITRDNTSPLNSVSPVSSVPFSSTVTGKIPGANTKPVEVIPLHEKFTNVPVSSVRDVSVSTGNSHPPHPSAHPPVSRSSSGGADSASLKRPPDHTSSTPKISASRTIIINSATRSVSSLYNLKVGHVDKLPRTDPSTLQASTPVESISIPKDTDKPPIIVKCSTLAHSNMLTHTVVPPCGKSPQLGSSVKENEGGVPRIHVQVMKSHPTTAGGRVVNVPFIATTTSPKTSTRTSVMTSSSSTAVAPQPVASRPETVQPVSSASAGVGRSVLKSILLQPDTPPESSPLSVAVIGGGGADTVSTTCSSVPYTNNVDTSKCEPHDSTNNFSTNGVSSTLVKTEAGESNVVQLAGQSASECQPGVISCNSDVKPVVSSSVSSVTATTSSGCPLRKRKRCKRAPRHLLFYPKRAKKHPQNTSGEPVVRRMGSTTGSRGRGRRFPKLSIRAVNKNNNNNDDGDGDDETGGVSPYHPPSGTRRSSRICARASISPGAVGSSEVSSIASPTEKCSPKSPPVKKQRKLVGAANKVIKSHSPNQCAPSSCSSQNFSISSIRARFGTTITIVPLSNPSYSTSTSIDATLSSHAIKTTSISAKTEHTPIETKPTVASSITPLSTKNTPSSVRTTAVRTNKKSSPSKTTCKPNVTNSRLVPPAPISKPVGTTPPVMVNSPVLVVKSLSPDVAERPVVKSETVSESIHVPAIGAKRQTSPRRGRPPRHPVRGISSRPQTNSAHNTSLVDASSQQMTSRASSGSSANTSLSAGVSTPTATAKNCLKAKPAGAARFGSSTSRLPVPITDQRPVGAPSSAPGSRSNRAPPIGPRIHVFNRSAPHRCSLVSGGRTSNVSASAAPESVIGAAVPITCRLDAGVPGCPRVAAASAFGRHYDVEQADSGWLCIFCRRRSHHARLGDLLGPCFIARPPAAAASSSVASVASPGRGRGRRRSAPQEIRPSPDDGAARVGDLVETWFHQDCIAWCDRVVLDASRIDGIEQAVSDCLNEVCVVCGIPGASVGCHARGCRSVYHVPCLLDSGGHLDYDQLRSTCSHHHRLSSAVTRSPMQTLSSAP